MESISFRALVQVESNSSQQQQQQQKLPAAPARAVSRTYPAVPQQEDSEDIIKLESIRYSRDNALPLGPSAPTTPRDEDRDLEMSVPGTPAEPADAFEALPSLWDPPMNRYRLATCCLMNLLGGLTDSAPGALIPYMETHYDIGYAIVSLIFVGNALGFIAAAPFVEMIRVRLGRARALGLSQVCIACGFAPLVAAAPFPVVCCAYFLLGFGYAVNLAMNNVFCANLRDGTAMLGAMHGSYGVGGTVGPLAATAIVSRAGGGDMWSRYYFITLGLALFNAAFGYWSFRGYEKESASGHADDLLNHDAQQEHPSPSSSSSSSSLSSTEEEEDQCTQPAAPAAAPAPVATAPTKQLSTMLAAFRSRVVVLGALFIFAYQGAEVSISGWVISFLIAARGGDPSRVGYVTAGFWAGITIGRFALSPLGARGQREKPFVYALTIGAAIFQLLVWWVPNVAGEAVSLAIVGLLLGPVYPCAAAVFARNLPGGGGHQVSGLGVISAFGSSGGAVAPFTTGLLAQAVGTFVLHPIAIGLFGVMMLTWWGQPNVRKRTE